MLANGHPNLLGFPSTVKSCSSGDSEIDGSIELLASGLSANDPDQIFTPLAIGSGGLARPSRRELAAFAASRTVRAASFETVSDLRSSISDAVSGPAKSCCRWPGEELRLRGGVATAPDLHSFASLLYYDVLRQLSYTVHLKAVYRWW